MPERNLSEDGPTQLDQSHALVDELQAKLDGIKESLPPIRDQLNRLHSRQIRYLLLIDEQDAKIAELEAQLKATAVD